MKKFLLALFLLVLLPPNVHAQRIQFGTTFSKQQCQYLDLDWKETYRAILDFPWDVIRLGAYWSETELLKDQYDFTDLDWQIKQAKEKNLSIILTVGMKAPRWPEYFIPSWVMEKTRLPLWGIVSDNLYLQERALKFIETVVRRYQNEMAIQYWQVENEPLNRFGGHRWKIGKAFLDQEVNLVHKIDRHNRHIILTVSTYPNSFLNFISYLFTPGDPIPPTLKLCDILGINVYPFIGQSFWGHNFYFTSSQKDRKAYFTKIRNMARLEKKRILISELQAEPWEPGKLVHKEKLNPPSSWPEDSKLAIKELLSLDYRIFLLWGCEYWYYQKTKHQNPQWLDMIDKIIKIKNKHSL